MPKSLDNQVLGHLRPDVPFDKILFLCYSQNNAVQAKRHSRVSR